RKTTAALASFGRALALEPGNAVAQGQVERIRRRERLIRYGQRGLIVAVGLALASAGTTQVYPEVQRVRAREAAAAALAASLAAASPRPAPPAAASPAAVAAQSNGPQAPQA